MEQRDPRRQAPCRSCGKRPGRLTSILGQLAAVELCDSCAELRKARIRANRQRSRGKPPT